MAYSKMITMLRNIKKIQFVPDEFISHSLLAWATYPLYPLTVPHDFNIDYVSISAEFHFPKSRPTNWPKAFCFYLSKTHMYNVFQVLYRLL